MESEGQEQPEETLADPPEDERAPESEPESEFRERVEALANDAREFFGFEAPLKLEVLDRPEGSPPAGRLRRSTPEPYEPTSKPMEAVIYRPADAIGRERLERMLTFMLPHEVAHNYPTPRSIELRALPGSEHKYFSAGTHLKPQTIFTGRDEVITDVLALRSLGGVGKMSEKAWDSYRSLLERMVEPHGRTATPWFRDSLRGLVEAEALAEDPAVPEAQRAWLTEWLARAKAVLDELDPKDTELLERAKDYLRRSYRAAWELPIGKPHAEVEPPSRE